MDALLILLEVSPFIAFVLVKRTAGLQKAIYSALGLGIATLLAALLAGQPMPALVVFGVSLGLLLGCGWLSLRHEDTLFFKLQPSLMGVVLGAGLLAGSLLWQDGLPDWIMAEFKAVSLEGEGPIMFVLLEPLLVRTMFYLGIGLMLLALLLTHAARKWSDKAWLFLRIGGFYGVALTAVILAMVSVLSEVS